MRTTKRMSLAVAVATFGCVVAACGPTAPDPTTSGPVPKTAPTTTTPPRSVATSQPRTSGSSSPATASPYTWARSASAALDVGGGATSTLSTVLAPPQPGDDWLLAGTRTAGNGDTTATVWTSPNATTWTAATLRGSGPHGQARGAAISGNRTVVVGSVGSGASQRAAVWISSAPGAPFSPVPDTPALGVPAGTAPAATAGSAEPAGDAGALVTSSGQGAVMDTVTAGALGLFASGTVAGRLALWYSTNNGTTWDRLSKAESVIGSSHGATVRQILDTPNGVFAVGSVRDGTSTDAALWTSSDAINWHQIPAPASFSGPGDQVLTGISTFGNDLVVAGGTRLASSWIPASWISPNSSTWGPPSESFPEPTGLRSDLEGTVVSDLTVSPNGTTLAAVGGSPTEQRLWTSTDGINWTPVAFPTSAADDADWTAGAVATTGTTTVVIDSEPGQPRMLVDTTGSWQEVSADPAVFGTPQAVATPTELLVDGHRLVMAVSLDQPGQALGEDQRSTVLLTSTDGLHWTAAATGRTFAGQTVAGLAATPSGPLAVGWPSDATLTQATPATTAPGITVWTSSGGAKWSVAGLAASGTTTSSTTVAAPARTATSPPATAAAGGAATPTSSTAATAHPGEPSATVAANEVATTADPVTTTSTTTPATTTSTKATVTGGTKSGTRATTAADDSPASAPTTVTTIATIPTTAPATVPASPGRRLGEGGVAPFGRSGAAVSSGGKLFVAGAASGEPAAGWTSGNGTTWSSTGTLDQAPPAAAETVAGACTTPSGPVAVGAVLAGPGGGSLGSVWPLAGHAATTVSPTPPTGAGERLYGCATVDGHLVAWGASAAGNGTPEASLWSSSDGKAWTRQSIGAFSAGRGTAAITDLAGDGPTWLAVTGSSTTAWTEDTLGALGVWVSTDAGKAWQEVQTTGAPWSSSYGVSADQVVYLGDRPVIAGDVDGRLAVWTGTATDSRDDT